MNNLKTNLYNPRVNFPDKLKEVILPEKQQIAILESMVRASLLCVHVERNKTAQEKAKFAQTCFLKLIKKARDRHGTSLINHLEIHAGFDSKVVECTLSETSFLKRNEFKKSLQTPERLDAYRLHQKQSLLVFDVELLIKQAIVVGGGERTGKMLDDQQSICFGTMITVFLQKHGHKVVEDIIIILWAYFNEFFVHAKGIKFEHLCLDKDFFKIEKKIPKTTEDACAKLIRHMLLEFDDDWIRSLFGREFQSSKQYLLGESLYLLFDGNRCYGD